MTENKHIHTIILDTGPIIRNEPTISSLLSQTQKIVTIPAVISEIKDAQTRSRFETTWRPFLDLREPKPASIKFVADFARRTGDLTVLSTPDIHVLALAYELECELNGSDWRLRRRPGQKELNGPDPDEIKILGTESAPEDFKSNKGDSTPHLGHVSLDHLEANCSTFHTLNSNIVSNEIPKFEKDITNLNIGDADEQNSILQVSKARNICEGALSDNNPSDTPLPNTSELNPPDLESMDSDSSSEGWITPTNIKKYQAKVDHNAATLESQPAFLKVATLTTDFAMQNVLLQMNLQLISTSFRRINHLKTQILRCHACFMNVKDMTKQFCPRCGKPTLTRVTCTTNNKGQFQLHLKKNMQWKTRGDRYSIPKPVPGSASGKINVGGGGKGGGKGGWGQSLILAEDQKEYVKGLVDQKREKQRNLMDEDYLPSIITGDRSRNGGRPKIGAGRTVNSRKR